jgi:uncharacterized membrane protein YfcA
MPDSPATFLIVIVGASLAGFAQGLSGFAFAMIALSVWAWALAPQVAAPLAVFGALMGQLLSLAQVRGGYDLRRIAPLVAGGAIGVPMGVFALHNFDPLKFKLAVGSLLVLYAGYGLLAGGDLRVKFGGRWLDAAVGLIGGALGGLGGMSGSVPAIWTQLRGWKRDLRRATMQVYNTTMHIFTLTVYAETGGLRALDWRLFALAAPAMLLPAYFGAHLYHRISERIFQRLILALLLFSGIAMLYGSLGLWRRSG